MFGAVGNTHWNITNCAASCSGAGSGNKGSSIYQKNTAMDDFAYKNDYGNYNTPFFDGHICRDYDNEKLYVPLYELCDRDGNQ